MTYIMYSKKYPYTYKHVLIGLPPATTKNKWILEIISFYLPFCTIFHILFNTHTFIQFLPQFGSQAAIPIFSIQYCLFSFMPIVIDQISYFFLVIFGGNPSPKTLEGIFYVLNHYIHISFILICKIFFGDIQMGPYSCSQLSGPP